jgi:predicted metalloprotease with PDZ domain
MPPIHYTVRFPFPHLHYAELEARFPVEGKKELELFLAVWTPGSYLIREYARHVECLAARTDRGEQLSAIKTRKNRWRISSPQALDEIIISYRLYCKELSVRTNFVDESFALLVGAATFLNIVNDFSRPFIVTLELPSHWSASCSGLPGTGNVFSAPNYDTLIDCPILAGNPVTQSFTVEQKEHLLVNVGDTALWDLPQVVGDVARIVREHAALWQTGLPYDRYLFLNLLTGGGGGLEHMNSVVMMTDRLAPRTRDSYIGWLDLVSHEFFHVWNVKRLRPAELGPFDYENEVYTSNLWIAEGFTEYYGLLAVRRSGLTTDEEFLGSNRPAGKETATGSLSGLIERLQTTPGRLQQPLALASFDAWIKLYRPDENSINSSISYYVKGPVIAWLLDARIRSATAGARSLDDVMRAAYARFSGPIGFAEGDFLAIIQEVSATDMKDWLQSLAHGTDELDYGDALNWFGLRFKPSAPPGTPTKAWTGFATKTEAGRLMVTQVPRNTPAWDAGVSVDDEILGIDGYRVRPDQWEQRMEQYRPLEEISILVSRRERLLDVTLRLAAEPLRAWLLELDPGASEVQRQHFSSWVGALASTLASVGELI